MLATRHCRNTSLLLALAFALLSGGCQHFEHVEECRRVAALINPILQDIDSARQKGPEDPRIYRVIAEKYDLLVLGIRGITLRTKRLGDALGEYQRVLGDASRDSRAFADALDSKDAGRIGGARAAASRTVRHESSALGRIDGLCRGH